MARRRGSRSRRSAASRSTVGPRRRPIIAAVPSSCRGGGSDGGLRHRPKNAGRVSVGSSRSPCIQGARVHVTACAARRAGDSRDVAAVRDAGISLGGACDAVALDQSGTDRPRSTVSAGCVGRRSDRRFSRLRYDQIVVDISARASVRLRDVTTDRPVATISADRRLGEVQNAAGRSTDNLIHIRIRAGVAVRPVGRGKAGHAVAARPADLRRGHGDRSATGRRPRGGGDRSNSAAAAIIPRHGCDAAGPAGGRGGHTDAVRGAVGGARRRGGGTAVASASARARNSS